MYVLGCGVEEGTFSASDSWVKSFLRRHRFSIRQRTRVGQDSLEDAVQAAQDFSKRLQAVIAEEGVTEIYNADETGKLGCSLYMRSRC